MKNDMLLSTAKKYLLSDIKYDSRPDDRIAAILEKLHTKEKLPCELIEFLNHECFVALYLLATGEVTFAEYLPLAREEQNERLESEGQEAQRIRFLAEAEEAERERQNYKKRMQERAEAEQQARIEEQRAREQDPRYQAKKREQALRRKYGLDSFIDQKHYAQLMGILEKLEKGSRIAEEAFIWLSTQGGENYRRYLTSEIWDRYHNIEANHSAAEFKRTGDLWHAVNASGHFRKCEEPEQAERLLRNINISQAKGKKLQSALSTTYGGVKRDLGRRNEALALGSQAHELTPRDFRPCTLLGAVHYEQGNYEQGQSWYEKAVQRGFKETQVDYELKTIFNRLENDRQIEMRQHLLSLDPKRYKWTTKQ